MIIVIAGVAGYFPRFMKQPRSMGRRNPEVFRYITLPSSSYTGTGFDSFNLAGFFKAFDHFYIMTKEAH